MISLVPYIIYKKQWLAHRSIKIVKKIVKKGIFSIEKKLSVRSNRIYKSI